MIFCILSLIQTPLLLVLLYFCIRFFSATSLDLKTHRQLITNQLLGHFSTGGALMSDQYLVLKNLLLRGKRPKYSICDVSPREFQDNF